MCSSAKRRRTPGSGIWISFGLAAILSGPDGADLRRTRRDVSLPRERSTSTAATPSMTSWVHRRLDDGRRIRGGQRSIDPFRWISRRSWISMRGYAIGLLMAVTLIVIGGVECSIWLSIALAGSAGHGPCSGYHRGRRLTLAIRASSRAPTVTGVISGAALVFFAFIGFDDIATLSEGRTTRATSYHARFSGRSRSRRAFHWSGIAAVSSSSAAMLSRLGPAVRP